MAKILYIDMDNVLVEFSTGIARLEPGLAREYEGRLDDVPGIFSLMDPVEGALDAFKTLSRAFDTYVLSTSPWENPSAWSDKLLWAKKYLGEAAYKRLILTHHKNLNHGDPVRPERRAKCARDGSSASSELGRLPSG